MCTIFECEENKRFIIIIIIIIAETVAMTEKRSKVRTKESRWKSVYKDTKRV